MYKLLVISFSFVVLTSCKPDSTEKRPIELLCKVQYLKCSDDNTTNECWHYDKPKWLFNLKTFLGASRGQDSFIIDEAKGIVQMDGISYLTQPDQGDRTGHYVDLTLLPDSISINKNSYKDCVSNGDCNFKRNERITINRMNGELLRESISTDGTINEVSLGSVYSQLFGYCTSDIKRKF